MKQYQTVIIIPTHNDQDRITRLTSDLLQMQPFLPMHQLEVLIVDNNSTDGTARMSQRLAEYWPSVQALVFETTQGNGQLLQTTSQYARQNLQADIVVYGQSNQSISLPRLKNILAPFDAAAELVVSPNHRSPKVEAIHHHVLDRIDWDDFITSGSAFDTELLAFAQDHRARISRIESPSLPTNHPTRLEDTLERVLLPWWLSLRRARRAIPQLLTVLVSCLAVGWLYWLGITGTQTVLASILAMAITSVSLVYLFQSFFNLYLMLYVWEDARELRSNQAPSEYANPELRFSLIVPARDEAAVIADTLEGINQIKYPLGMVETLVVCRRDDQPTIQAVQTFLNQTQAASIKLVVFDDHPINKPHGLNVALAQAQGDIVGVFDAEDQVHPEILQIINTTFINKRVDIVQAGVQLMNYTSQWFSTLNVLEYFFWFKSSLHFFAKHQVIPLGGNTVFFKRTWLERFSGWDEAALTEDADIGLRMSQHGAKTAVVYDEAYVTQEETPDSVTSFIKQRTRWNQGFIQVLTKGAWLKLDRWSQRFLALYVLLIPEIQALGFVLVPVSIIFAFSLKLPAITAMLTVIPLFFLFIQMIVYNVGLWEFARKFNRDYSLGLIIKVLLTYIPFQLMLGLGAARGVYRYVTGRFNWEKTAHTNAHRSTPAPPRTNRLESTPTRQPISPSYNWG